MADKHLKLLLIALLSIAIAGCNGVTFGKKRFTPNYYKVRKGDTLYAIAWGYGRDFRKIAQWNKIPSPYHIHPGQLIRITPSAKETKSSPTRVERTASASSSKERASPSVKRSPKRPPHKVSKSSKQTQKSAKRSNGSRRAASSGAKPASSGAKPASSRAKPVWQWPTQGKVNTRFRPAKGDKGIDIGGKVGQPIFAAAAGDVVYSGKGLIGYGNLVIVKHSDVYLSAYGHNRRLLVAEGDRVVKGAKIAEMGTSNKAATVLHFEIRKYGKPVDPMRFLPQ